MKIRRAAAAAAAFIIFLFAAVPTRAADVYTFDPDDIDSDSADGEYEKFMEKLPEDAADHMDKKDISGYDAKYFVTIAAEALRQAAGPAFGTLAALLGIVILSSSFNIFSKTVKREAATAFSICSTLCVSLAVWNVQKGVFDTAELLLRTMTDTMTAVVPTMEAMFISSGNITSAAVTSAGVNTMIALSETLFSRFLYPAAVVCWLLAVCSAVTENSGITFMSKAVKSTVSGVLITVMALCGFVMALQVETAQSADSFTQRTLRYAVGSYVPIVGGSVSESFSRNCVKSFGNTQDLRRGGHYRSYRNIHFPVCFFDPQSCRRRYRRRPCGNDLLRAGESASQRGGQRLHVHDSRMRCGCRHVYGGFGDILPHTRGNGLMGAYIYSVLCAALFCALICAAAPKSDGCEKFVAFAGALAVSLTVLSPLADTAGKKSAGQKRHSPAFSAVRAMIRAAVRKMPKRLQNTMQCARLSHFRQCTVSIKTRSARR